MKNSIKLYQNKVLKKPLLSFLLLYLLITVAIIVIGLYYFSFQKDKLIDNRFAYLKSMAEFHSSQINDWLVEKYNDLKIIEVSMPPLHGVNFSSSGLPKEINDWFSILKKYNGYENVILINASMKAAGGLVPYSSPLMKSDSLLIRMVLDSNMVAFSDSDEKTADQNLLRFYLPVGYPERSKKRNAVLFVSIDSRTTFESILNRNIDKSPTLEALLVKAVDDSVAYLNKLRFSDRIRESRKGDDNKALYKTSPITDRHGFVSGIDYKNDPVIANIQKIQSTAWLLITKLNQSEFYEPVNNLAGIVVLVIISADLLFALILFFIWRKNIVENARKIYESEIEKSRLENRFQSLMNGVKNIEIILLDKDGKIISWNKGAENIEGYSPDEITGKPVSVLYTEEDRRKGKPEWLLREAAVTGNVQTEGWRIRKNGSVFWANVFTTSLTDEQLQVYGYIIITHDMTENRKNEEEIKKSRDFYLKLLDDFPNPVWRSDINGDANYFNKAWLAFTGRDIESEIGEGWISGVHPEDRDTLLKEYREAFRYQKGFTHEYRLKKSDGQYRWFVDFGMPYSDFEGNFAGFLGSCYDINDRIKYEETINTLLRISEKLYSSLEINQILDSLVAESIKLAGAEKGFAAVRDENGFSAARYFNNDHWEYLEKKYDAHDQKIMKFISANDGYLSNAPLKDEFEEREIIDRYGVNQLLSTPLFGSDGELIGFFEIHNKKNKNGAGNFTADDLNLLRAVAKNASVAITKSLNYEKLRQTESQLRNSEKELRNLAAQIQYAREAERQHIAREVHDELGQLFTGINLNISLLTELFEQNTKPSVEEILTELHSVQEFVNKGIQIVRDISGSLRSYVLDHLGLIPAIQEYCREVERISGIECSFESEFESVNIDDEKNVALFRIIQEALTNVMRHAEATLVELKITGGQNILKFIISDNGKGIPPAKESFNRSMGILGMKERAIFLGGKLNIESGEGKGTTICLSIPADKILARNGAL